jgi:hypothetical protein
MITLDLNNVKDGDIKQAFERLLEQLNAKTVLLGDWKHIEYNAPASGNYHLNHGLKFKPTDIIVLYDATASVVFDHTLFTPTTVYLTVTGPGVIRFLVGKQNRGT